MKIQDLTVLSIGLLTLGLSVSYDIKEKTTTVKVTGGIWEKSWVF